MSDLFFFVFFTPFTSRQSQSHTLPYHVMPRTHGKQTAYYSIGALCPKPAWVWREVRPVLFGAIDNPSCTPVG